MKFVESFANLKRALFSFGFLAFISFSIPSVIAVVIISVNFWERKALVSTFSFFIFGFFSFILTTISLLILVILKYVIARNFNFILFDYRFFPTKALYWVMYTHFLTLFAIFYYFLLLLFGHSRKTNCLHFLLLFFFITKMEWKTSVNKFLFFYFLN